MVATTYSRFIHIGAMQYEYAIQNAKCNEMKLSCYILLLLYLFLLKSHQANCYLILYVIRCWMENRIERLH